MSPHAVSVPMITARPGVAANSAFHASGDASTVERRDVTQWGGAAVAAAPADALDAKRLELAVHGINNAMHIRSIGVQFQVQQDTNQLVVRVVDRDSGVLIRQIPSEEALRLSMLLNPAPVALFQRHG
ncbi:flagellar protein FlaG [Variovorax ginsengisoli]|uniref:Flagellar protein FlaG n=1 Tax=Variovorax ginsengisoli TaxID=363844 RepID=A0ABT9SD64_9BURK|nr:flagellar protein FlaG [Variovorax ginsengisoli]MDP9902303.1 flagellar protein FlaG [Variovorax ginsengisoli]